MFRRARDHRPGEHPDHPVISGPAWTEDAPLLDEELADDCVGLLLWCDGEVLDVPGWCGWELFRGDGWPSCPNDMLPTDLDDQVLVDYLAQTTFKDTSESLHLRRRATVERIGDGAWKRKAVLEIVTGQAVPPW